VKTATRQKVSRDSFSLVKTSRDWPKKYRLVSPPYRERLTRLGATDNGSDCND